MKAYIFVFLISLFMLYSSSIFAKSDWSFKPSLYSRGGITSSANLENEGINKEVFNLGKWADESNVVRNAKTEAELEIKYLDQFRYVYGIDVQNNNRFLYSEDSNHEVSLKERINFLEFIKNNFLLWFGHRVYEGEIEHLTQTTHLDQRNFFGAGVKVEEVFPVNLEFALGYHKLNDISPEIDASLVNIFINKIIYPLSKGRLKTNLEFHKVNTENDNNKTTGIIAGLQLQNWGIKIFEGTLYNTFVINYSKGYIFDGYMQSSFNSIIKDQKASKLVALVAGDYKKNQYGFYYALRYQTNKGSQSQDKWSFFDLYIQPMYKIFENFSSGLNYAERFIIDNADKTSLFSRVAFDERYRYYQNRRISLLAKYHIKDAIFSSPASFRLWLGKIYGEKKRIYYAGKEAKKNADFLRLEYEIMF